MNTLIKKKITENITEKITPKEVLVIAIPMVLANTCIPFLGLVDTTIAGHLENANYLSAVEVGDTIFGFIYMLFSFLRLAVTGLTAQAVGEQAKEQQRAILVQGLVLSSCLGLALALTPNTLLRSLLSFVSTDQHVQQLSFHYLTIRLLSVPAGLGNLVISAFLLGMKQAKFSMYLLLVINIIAMIFDGFFAYYLNMGINGLAYAIVLGQYIGLIFGILTALHLLEVRFNLASIVFQKSYLNFVEGQLAQFFHINHNLLIRAICFITVYGIFLVSSAKLGPMTLAANSILLAFYSFISLGLEGFANAAEVLIGQAVGKHNLTLFKQAIFVSLFCALLTAFGLSLIYIFAGPWIINCMTDLPQVRLLSTGSLIWISILPLICVWCYLLDAVFLGMLRVKAMRNSLVIATLVFFVPLWQLTQALGNTGLWLSLLGFFIGRTIVLSIDLMMKPLTIPLAFHG